MTVYVDDTEQAIAGMILCNMWADIRAELLEMADRVGLPRDYLREPPNARWVHFVCCKKKRRKAVRFGAVETDNLGPTEHYARRVGDHAKLARIAAFRAAKEQP